MPSFLTSKPVLYGGAAIVAIIGYMYLKNQAANSSSASSSPTIYPTPIVYGASGNTGITGSTVDTTGTQSTGTTISSADQSLIDLQNSQLALQSKQVDNNYNLSVLTSGYQNDQAMANIAATSNFNQQTLNSQELTTLTKTLGSAFGYGAKSVSANIGGTPINVGFSTMGIAPPGSPTPQTQPFTVH